MKSTLLVTGGAGFIGSCYVRMCAQARDAHVVNLDKLTYAASEESLQTAGSDWHTLVKGDITDEALVAELLAKWQPRAVIHFAAETHVDRSIDSPGPFVQTNVVGTVNLLSACLAYWRKLPNEQKDRFRFIYVSTDEVYGSAADGRPFHELSPATPSSPYAASKTAGGHFCAAFHATYGFPTIQTRCSNNFGPYQFPEKLIPLVTLNAAQGRTLPVYGDGQQTRDWLYVDDHCSAITAVLERGVPGEVYNVASGQGQTNIEIVQQICDLVDEEIPNLPHQPCRSLIEFVTDRPGHDTCYAVDTAKIRSELGWQPQHSFAAALQQTVRWYLQNKEWVQGVDQRYERNRLGLGSS